MTNRNHISTRTAPNKANIPELTTKRPAPLELEELPAADPVLLATLLVATEPLADPVAVTAAVPVG